MTSPDDQAVRFPAASYPYCETTPPSVADSSSRARSSYWYDCAVMSSAVFGGADRALARGDRAVGVPGVLVGERRPGWSSGSRGRERPTVEIGRGLDALAGRSRRGCRTTREVPVHAAAALRLTRNRRHPRRSSRTARHRCGRRGGSRCGGDGRTVRRRRRMAHPRHLAHRVIGNGDDDAVRQPRLRPLARRVVAVLHVTERRRLPRRLPGRVVREPRHGPVGEGRRRGESGRGVLVHESLPVRVELLPHPADLVVDPACHADRVDHRDRPLLGVVFEGDVAVAWESFLTAA